MKFKWYPLLFVGLISLLGSFSVACSQTLAPTSAPPAPTPRADIRLTISRDTVYYVVSGETTKEIFNSVRANGPDYGAMKKGWITMGLTQSDHSYEWKYLNQGAYCEPQSVDINMRLVVTLPRHSTPQALSGLQASRVRGFVDMVAVHEQKHVDIYIDGVETFKKRLESHTEKFSDCDSLKSSVASAWESEWTLINQEQDAFHLAEEQLSQRLREPIQMQIDQKKSELEQLQYELDSLLLEIDALKLEIDDLERAAQPYKDQIDVIQRQYPGLVLPPSIFDEYERLRAEWNRLNDLRSGVIAQTDAPVRQHKRLSGGFSRLVELTNQLIEELAWLP